MKRIAVIILSVLALGGVTAGTSPASATTATMAESTGQDVGTQAWWDCPDEWFCIWYDTDGNGKMARFQKGAPDLRKFEPLHDHVWSAWNRTGETWCVFRDINYARVSGQPWPVGNWRGNTSQYGMQNVISSLRRGGC
ncbi:peptidase inhibitor family I36 protein [Actinosynnema sp. NPDC050436]|uniref:peptidase inhibitor family I36 protein n=1 Tax=Actinosynnema sp. NPDC050436 TaxID=3155659 RepID=UPI0033E79051